MLSLRLNYQVSEALYDISGALQRPIGQVKDAVSYFLAETYRTFIVAVGAVDTGELLFSVHVEEGPSGSGMHTNYVIASADHAAIIEFGWTNRAQGQASYPGRHPGRMALDYTIAELQSGRIVDALDWRLGR